MQKVVSLLLLLLMVISCKNPEAKTNVEALAGPQASIKYAKGFELVKGDGYSEITITNPWPDSDQSFKYLLLEEPSAQVDREGYDAVVTIPVESIVVTSTTHIPSLELLGVEEKLIGFPNLNYISSEKTRALIEAGAIRELGKNEDLNTEILIDNQPDVVVTFAVEGQNTAVNTIERAGIPVLYNADWTETHPLGKAEWIKFFGLLFGKEALSEQAFDKIEDEYLQAKAIASKASTQPTVLSGAMYKDIWYLPQGDSWAAQFIRDANAHYLWADREGTGSIALNLESVLETAQDADFWIGPSQFTSYEQLLEANKVYGEFKAFKDKKVYSFTLKKGETGGVIYYELAPNRPDLVLKDLIKILHPELLPSYEPYFFAPLQ